MRARATGTLIKFGVFAVVMAMLTAFLFFIFGQYRTGAVTGYSAVFNDASRLKTGDSVRVAGIRVGTVNGLSLQPDKKVVVKFDADRSVVLTDGTRLYVQESVNGRYVIGQVAVTGGDTVVMNTPFPNACLNNISPDKTELVVGSFSGVEIEQPLWAVPVVGGAPRRFSDIPGEDGAWMPRGDDATFIAKDEDPVDPFDQAI